MDKTTLRTLLSIGNSRDANLQADVTQAFLWADLDEEVYVTAPPGYDLGRDAHGRPLVFRVLKAIYGLKAQAQEASKAESGMLIQAHQPLSTVRRKFAVGCRNLRRWFYGTQ